MTNYPAPGIYIENTVLPVPTQTLRTGVPLFIGLVSDAVVDQRAFIKLPFPDAISGLCAVRSKRVLTQLGAKTQEVRALRKQDAATYFLAHFPEPNGGDDDLAHANDPWLVNISHTERFNLWSEFALAYGTLLNFGYLAAAVRGFFANDGQFCRLQMVCYNSLTTPLHALQEGLKAVEAADDIDLVCAPDIMWLRNQGEIDSATAIAMQNHLLDHCDRLGDRFAILDPLPDEDLEQVTLQQAQLAKSKSGALYFPFIGIEPTSIDPTTMGAAASASTITFVPPCGHIAGVYARSDERVGVFKAPANEVLEGVVQLEVNLDADQLAELHQRNINCLRAFPRRGIRIWGARTLSAAEDARYVSVRRLFIAVKRWIERNMMDETFEVYNDDLWARIRRDVSIYLSDLFQRGGLRGSAAREAYYVKCDADINPEEVRDAGMVIAEIGLAAAAPSEFIVVRVITDRTGVTIVSSEE